MKRQFLSNNEVNEFPDTSLEKKIKTSTPTIPIFTNPTISTVMHSTAGLHNLEPPASQFSEQFSDSTVHNETNFIPILEPNLCNAEMPDDVIDFKDEPKVGICEFRNNNLKEFVGIIKLRYSDFQVNEISLDNHVVHLTTLDYNCAAQQENEAAFNAEDDRIIKLSSEEMDTEIANIVTDLDYLQQMVALDSNHSADTISLPMPQSKPARTQLHKLIRFRFNHLISTTNENQIIVKYSENKLMDFRQYWPKNLPKYCQCVLYKENYNTLHAIQTILSHMKLIHFNSVTFAGTKDRRAKTSQLLTFNRIKAKRLHGLNKRLPENIRLGNFTYVEDTLKMGHLIGNEFRIVLRNVTTDYETIKLGMESLNRFGFINYFGLQRFGLIGAGTHIIGQLILQHKFKEAVELIIGSLMNNSKYCEHEASQIWRQTSDPSLTLELLPKSLVLERIILKEMVQQLKSGKINWLSVLSKLPSQSRKLYTHAYQSYIWNKSVSQRMAHGFEFILGDCIQNADNQIVELDDQLLTELSHEENPIEKLIIYTVGLDDTNQERTKVSLAQDGIKIEDILTLPIEFRIYSQSRNVIVKPIKLDWECIKYNDNQQDLIMSDLDKINEINNSAIQKNCVKDNFISVESDYLNSHTDYNKRLIDSQLEATTTSCEQVNTEFSELASLPGKVENSIKPIDEKFQPNEPIDNNLTAILLKFQLPKGSYATMALREVLRHDTNPTYQARLSKIV